MHRYLRLGVTARCDIPLRKSRPLGGIRTRGGSRVLRGGSLSQFYDQNVCESAFAVLWLQLMVAFAAFAILSRNFASVLSHAFAHTFAARARFGAYLRSICVSEAEAWIYESSGCSLTLPNATDLGV